jgi:hypothetical protein
MLFRVAVLLRDGDFEAVECPREDLFLTARVRQAGICGVFDDREAAHAFIDRLRQERLRLGYADSDTA